MAIRYTDKAPQEIRFYPDRDDVAARMQPEHVEQVAEIFETPLVGAYNWDYEECDAKIKRLYDLGKKLNWDAQVDVDWSQSFPHTEEPMEQGVNPFEGWDRFEEMSDERKLDFAWHNFGWLLSQFMHGEQGALLVASQLVSCAPTYDAKLYAASQTFDEARHVEVFSRYLRDKVRIMYPVNPNLKLLLDKVLSDPRWDLKFIGMQIIIEGLALAAFHTFRMTTRDPLFRQIVDYVIRDEARHVAFGVTYMERFVKSLSHKEIEDRALFSYEANILMRERLIATEVHEEFGFPLEEARARVLDHAVMDQFRNFLFTRIIPNLRKIGLLTDSVRPKYDELGILEYENLVDDGVIDWATLEKGEVPAPMPG
ncbi:MAG: ferritin-like domain-containing protein [Myxococcota bacterium]